MRSVVYASQIDAPSGAVPADFAPPPTELDIREAFAVAAGAGLEAVRAADASVPAVPWNRWGLSRTPIDPSAMRLDEERGAYVVDLDDGSTAVLTLDPALQSRLQTVVGRYAEPGEAIVVVEPATGRVLAMVSDSSHGAVGDNLALRAYAWAASTFKVITGAALLGEGVATNNTELCYHGGGSSVELSHLTPSPNDSICVDLTGAMATSANVYFARMADQHLTPELLQEYAERFGYNARIPFEAPLEPSVANIPTSRLAFAQSAAGFRHTLLSPLHGAMIEAAIANDGEMMVPALVGRIELADGSVSYEHEPVVWRRVLSAEVAREVARSQSTTCTTGTARSHFALRDGFPAAITSYGKTGTLSNRGIDGSTPDPLFTYTWFIGVSERDGREVAVSALAVNTDLWWVKGGFLASEAVIGALGSTTAR